MNKTFLSILIALVVVFSATGVTVAAAKQSQPGEPLYALRTWSMQMFGNGEKMQASGQANNITQTGSSIHESETTHTMHSPQDTHLAITSTPQLLTPEALCDESGIDGQCGFNHDRVGEHLYDQHHDSNETHHDDKETHHDDGGAGHENEGHD